ncbi:MAG: hypothetical protein ACTSQ3_01650 [Candidatus Heimdallarchaeota archaeon]
MANRKLLYLQKTNKGIGVGFYGGAVEKDDKKIAKSSVPIEAW